MLKKRNIVTAKIESVEGIGETLSTSDVGILVLDMQMVHVNGIFFKRIIKLYFKIEIVGADSAYSYSNLPVISKYLRACGFSEAVDETPGSEKVIYRPMSIFPPSLTIECHDNGNTMKIIGARGNVKISAKMVEPVFAKFFFEGYLDNITSGQPMPLTYMKSNPPFLLSGASFEVNMNNKLLFSNNCAIVGERNPTVTIDRKMINDRGERWKEEGEMLNICNVGKKQYNRFKITAPKTISEGEYFTLLADRGDDEIEIEFS